MRRHLSLDCLGFVKLLCKKARLIDGLEAALAMPILSARDIVTRRFREAKNPFHPPL